MSSASPHLETLELFTYYDYQDVSNKENPRGSEMAQQVSPACNLGSQKLKAGSLQWVQHEPALPGKEWDFTSN